ncbi:MAG: ABC transporter substrate-binding protein [Ignavibacteria bacterium RBG_13_36_8]|nr:MAG: ABC transporter substrate-binding protein [Ignavibacteria bacterium RBG_13_36_8]
MRDNRKTEIKVGITVSIAIIIIILIFGWAKNLSLNSERKILTLKFNSIAGLDVGDGVMINGYKMGYVNDVIIKENYALIKVNLDKEVDIREDAKFSIMMLDLMGGKKIEIDPGKSKQLIDYSIVHEGDFLGDISTAMAMLSSVQSDMVDVIREIKVTLTNMNSVIADDEFNKNLKQSINNLKLLTRNMNNFLQENRMQLQILINSSSELVNNTKDLLKQNRTVIDSILANADNLMKNSSLLLNRLNEFAKETSESNNNLGRVLYDEKFMMDLKTSIEQVKELTQILIEQLKGEGLNLDIF